MDRPFTNLTDTELISKYKAARRSGYAPHMGTKRKTLVDKFGYDTKNAAHLIRLLRMGAEFLKDGQLIVKRHDAQQLLEIKRGEWTLDQVKAEADWGFKMAEQAYHNSNLPVGPDMDEIGKLAVRVVSMGTNRNST